LYWGQLEGPKHILYVPNNGHGLKDFPRVLGGIAALHEQAGGGRQLPALRWSFNETNTTATIQVASDIHPTKCQIWTASSKTNDFRDALWTATEVMGHDSIFDYQLDLPAAGAVAFFGEVVYERERWPLYLSTNVHVVPVKRDDSAQTK
jgi:PhoPQ-activated pathogenicity-related protein